MVKREGIEYFIYILFPPIVLLTGLIGNITGLIVMSRKKLAKFTIRNVYRFLFVSDTAILIQIVIAYMQLSIEYDPTITSTMFCKVFSFFNYAFGPISSLLIVYISCERLISIKYFSGKNYLSVLKIQILFYVLVIVFNIVYYLGIAFYFDVQTSTSQVSNTTNETQTVEFCTFIDKFSLDLFSYMDLINRAVVPFVLMILSTILLTHSIFKSRHRISGTGVNESDRKRFRKDLKFTITSIFLNLVYIFLQMPVSITIFFPNYWISPVYVFSLFLFYASYAVNFYTIITFNSIVRNEFLVLFGLNTIANKTTTVE